MTAQQEVPANQAGFAERLRIYREAAGLSQEQLAAKVGVSQTAIGQWERGTFTPRGRNVNALAAALGVSANELRGTSNSAADLFAARLRAGLTQDKLAEMVGVTQQTVAKWEGGLAMPRSHHRNLAAEALGIDRANASAVAAPTVASELLMAELIIVTMLGALTTDQKAKIQGQLEAVGVAGVDMIRSQERRAAIVAGSAA